MKHIVSIPLLVIYLAVSIGVPITVHYCGGEVEEVAVMQSDIHCCCEAIKEKSCCGTEGHFVNLETDQHWVRSLEFHPVFQVASIPTLPSFQVNEEATSGAAEHLEIDLPPPKNQPLWLAHCSLTYYG